jgi:Family of unknown function (DUF6516)
MNISAVYEKLARVATGEFGDIVLQARVLHLSTGDPLKLRLDIVDQSVLDVWLSTGGRYSYHWERRHTDKGDLYRYDNAPHKRWRQLASFPHHFHNGTENMVAESRINPDPEEALRQVLTFVREKLLGK